MLARLVLEACLGRDIQTEIRVMREGQAQTSVSQRKMKTQRQRWGWLWCL